MEPHVFLFLLIEYSQIVLGNRLWAALLEQRGWAGWSPEALSNPKHSVKVQCLSMLRCLQHVGYRGMLSHKSSYFVKCFLRADILLYTLFTALHSLGTNWFSSVLLTEKENPSFDSACAISQCLVNGTNCPASLSFFVPFMPVLRVFEILFSYQSSMANIVSNATASELSFHFSSMFNNSYLLQEKKAFHFHC